MHRRVGRFSMVRRARAAGKLALVGLCVLIAVPLAGQDRKGTATLMGTVTAEDGKPLEGALIRVINLDVGELSSRRGTFRIPQLPAGAHYITAEYLGLRSDTVRVGLSPSATTYVTLRMQTNPVKLPELAVRVRRVIRNPYIAGFYERRDRGLGKFITSEDLRRRDLITNLRRIPGVRVDQCVLSRDRTSLVPILSEAPTRQTDERARDFILQGSTGSRMGAGCYEVKIGRGYGSGAFNQRCVPEIWVDGHLINSSFADPFAENPFNRIRNLPMQRIEGIEVYRNAAMAPVQYRTFGACGIMLVWMKGR